VGIKYPYCGIRFVFHPVGQGLFASGALDFAESGNRSGPRMEWVYDCGTHSAAPAMDDALNGYHRRARAPLELLALSHFDKDHINGVIRLIARRPVGTLLLPYLSLGQRVTLALAHGVGAADPEMAFYTNPVGFLSGGDARIREVVFVPPSNSEDQRPQPPPEIPPPADNPDDRPPLEYESHQGDDEQQRDLDTMRGVHGPAIRMLRPGGALRYRNFWEFVPYNDARYAHLADPAFIDAARRAADALLETQGSPQAQKELDTLKKHYDAKFGKRRRNEISLFLYGGATGAYQSRQTTWNHWAEELRDGETRRHYQRYYRESQRNGVLYTGDGTLESSQRLAPLLEYLGPTRVKNLSILQVMHHGSSHNWHEGVARALAPDVAVFCADPAHKKFRHPHGDVVRDFLPYGPALADLERGWEFNYEGWHF
jgi:hypothetical protein